MPVGGPRLHRLLPPLAIMAAVLPVAGVLWAAGDTLGYDLAAYIGAAARLLEGEPLYDRSVEAAGGFAIFLYPPPVAVAFVPLALLPDEVATWTWVALLTGAVGLAIALMPVPARVRWTMLLLAGISWPVVYSIKLGQVGPLLLLLFTLAWRSLDRAPQFGVVAALGTLLKVQPALLIAWAILTRRARAALFGCLVLVSIAAVSLPAVGATAYRDYAELLSRISSPVTTPHNFTLGAILFQAGVAEPQAHFAQLLTILATIGAVVLAARVATPAGGLMTAAVATQLLSPVLWDHYAIVVLLPTAYLLAKGRTWALLLPLATSVPFAFVAPPVTYPVVLLLGLVTPILSDRGVRRSGTPRGVDLQTPVPPSLAP